MRTKITIITAKAANEHVCALNEGHVAGVNMIVADLVNTVKRNAKQRFDAMAADSRLPPALHIQHTKSVHARALESGIGVPD